MAADGNCRVNLLVSVSSNDVGTGGDDESEEIRYARAVCESLSRQFGVGNVVLRSAQTPVEDWISSRIGQDQQGYDSSEPHEAEMLVFLSATPTATSTSCLDRESPIPVLVLDRASTGAADAALAIAKWCSLSSLKVRKHVQKALEIQKQARRTLDARLRTTSPSYASAIAACYDAGATVTGDQVSLPGRNQGKVRDRYGSDKGKPLLALVTTDRQSGFDRMLAQVPYKGAVLNLTSAFWFQQTAHIIPNHLVSVPHPNVSIVKQCTPFPVEFVVRAYMTGSTSTSIWKNYQDGVRNYCGHELPEGMVKNQRLAHTLLTPTTKEEHHDRPISLADIVEEKWMTQQDLDACAEAALKVFALGQEVASRNGLILVDTKYEFGKDADGNILLIDEVHTPDSSRYWLASTYEERLAQGKEPDNIDKEFLRLWFRDHCDPYNDQVLPAAPRDLVLELSRRYITLYEMITGRTFRFDTPGEDAIAQVIQASL